MKVLITGGTGYLGSHVRRFFGADDLSRRSGKDVLDPRDVSMAGEYDVVIHLAAHLDKSQEGEGETFHTNVEGTINVLKNMREDAAFIFASTKDVYGRFADNYKLVKEDCPTLYSGQTPLEWSKLVAERYVEYYAHSRHFRSCIFRLSTVYAPPSPGNTPSFVGHYADAVNTGEPIALPGGGSPRRDIMHVDDLSRACQAFVDSVIRHGLYNLGGGAKNAMTLRELVTKMEEVSGLQAVIDEEAKLPNPIPMNYVSDISRVDQELGWQPTMPMDDGLKSLFAA
ncbi:MAG TPA: NAD(P)-dependent oxidoreductase [Pyrinomonadaceae bacterium]|nr:NAD(P)-dependent oxidoreductase [Pyrinomonadaceae bacterium]